MRMALKNFATRFLTIGFTADHDAKFLNDITSCGSEEGNFFYIDTNMPDYKDQIKECLADSLSMVEFSNFKVNLSSFNCGVDKTEGMLKFLHVEEEEEEKDDVMAVEETMKTAKFQFEKELILPKNVLDDLKVSIVSADGTKLEIQVQAKQMDDPSAQLKVKASLLHINNELFQSIQAVTKDPSIETQKRVHEQIQSLDKTLNDK